MISVKLYLKKKNVNVYPLIKVNITNPCAYIAHLKKSYVKIYVQVKVNFFLNYFSISPMFIMHK